MTLIDGTFQKVGDITKDQLKAIGAASDPTRDELAKIGNITADKVKLAGKVRLTWKFFLMNVAAVIAAVGWLQQDITLLPDPLYNLAAFANILFILFVTGVGVMIGGFSWLGNYLACKEGKYDLSAKMASIGRPFSKAVIFHRYLFLALYIPLLVAGGHVFWLIVYLIGGTAFMLALKHCCELQLTVLGAVRSGMTAEEGVKTHFAS